MTDCKDLIKLKRCPFCGSEKLYQQSFECGFSIICNCGAEGPTACEDDENGKEEAIKLWNERK